MKLWRRWRRGDLTMATATISIEVDSDAARAFAEASADERRKLQLLLSLRLRELTASTHRPLQQIMDEMGLEAEKRGLTPTILSPCCVTKAFRTVVDTGVVISAALLPRSVP